MYGVFLKQHPSDTVRLPNGNYVRVDRCDVNLLTRERSYEAQQIGDVVVGIRTDGEPA